MNKATQPTTTPEIDYDLLAQKMVQYTQDRMLSGDEVRERLGGISKATLWRWKKDEIIPQPIKNGASVMWVKSDIDDHIKSLKQVEIKTQ